jgi:TfoX/Sxy family transcriptional regulator of competence genes
MAYEEKLADRIRKALAGLPNIEEKEMMGGLTFMYNDKMCVGIIAGEMMCRIDPGLHNIAVEKTGCRVMDFTKRPMKGYVMVDGTGMKTKKEFDYWINLCLKFNHKAKSSKKNKKKIKQKWHMQSTGLKSRPKILSGQKIFTKLF